MKNKRNVLFPIAGGIFIAGGILLILAGMRSVTSDMSVDSMPLEFSVTGTLLLAAGGALVIYWYQRRGREGEASRGDESFLRNRRESRSGEGAFLRGKGLLPRGRRPKGGCITAEIIGVSRNLRFAGEKVAYHVVCRYTDPDSGETITYSSDPLDEYPGKEIIGKTVRVYLDQKEEGCYRVDLSTIA